MADITYSGYTLRTKGDHRVRSTNASGQAAMHLNMVNAKRWIDGGGTIPAATPNPTLVSLTPNTAPAASGDILIAGNGTNLSGLGSLTQSAAVVPTTYVSVSKVNGLLHPLGAGVVPVTLRQAGFETASVNFTFT